MNLKNKLFHILILASAILFLATCNSSDKTKQGQDNAQNPKKELETKPSQAKIVEVTYESCTVYAGSTKFFFKPTQGELIEVSTLNKGMADEELYRIKMPDNLVDDSKDLEGLPGANPKMVGKKFQLIYNDKNEVIEIKPL
jgi:hypothetical protein